MLADLASPDNAVSIGPLEALTTAVGQIVEAARAVGAALLVVGGRAADNSFPLVNLDDGTRIREHGEFCDLAPTLLELLQLPQPEDVAGVSLFER